jgi:hypothetical protein
MVGSKIHSAYRPTMRSDRTDRHRPPEKKNKKNIRRAEAEPDASSTRMDGSTG